MNVYQVILDQDTTKQLLAVCSTKALAERYVLENYPDSVRIEDYWKLSDGILRIRKCPLGAFE